MKPKKFCDEKFITPYNYYNDHNKTKILDLSYRIIYCEET